MLKKLLILFAFIFLLLVINNEDLFAIEENCPNYFIEYVIDDIRYRFEYACDGTLVNIQEIYE